MFYSGGIERVPKKCHIWIEWPQANSQIKSPQIQKFAEGVDKIMMMLTLSTLIELFEKKQTIVWLF